MSEDDLLRTLVEAEHAAIYGYGVLGGRLADPLRTLAREADDAHRTRRDQLIALLRERRSAVPATQAAYDVAVARPSEALALAVRLEEGLGQRWRDLVGGTDDRGLRALGVAGLTDTAVRAARWRRAQGRVSGTVALPGSG